MYWNSNANYRQDGTAGLTLTWDVLKYDSRGFFKGPRVD